MTTATRAIYEHGVLRLAEPVDLPEGAAVDVLVVHEPAAPDPRQAAEVLRSVADLPLERLAQARPVALEPPGTPGERLAAYRAWVDSHDPGTAVPTPDAYDRESLYEDVA